MRRLAPLLALALALPGGALAQDREQEAPADPEEHHPFLKGDKQSTDAPPLRLTRPSDAWQFVDLERLRKERGASAASLGTLKFQLWYGAARASIFVRAYTLRERDVATIKDVAGNIADQQLKELQGKLRDPEIKARKRIKVGKRAGHMFELRGQVADRRDPTKLKPHVIMTVVCYRPEDRAVLTIALEFGDEKRHKQLEKDYKRVLKKVKF